MPRPVSVVLVNVDILVGQVIFQSFHSLRQLSQTAFIPGDSSQGVEFSDHPDYVFLMVVLIS